MLMSWFNEAFTEVFNTLSNEGFVESSWWGGLEIDAML